MVIHLVCVELHGYGRKDKLLSSRHYHNPSVINLTFLHLLPSTAGSIVFFQFGDKPQLPRQSKKIGGTVTTQSLGGKLGAKHNNNKALGVNIMDEWTTLIEAGKQLSRAYTLLDRSAEIACLTGAAIITKQGLHAAAHQAVDQATTLLLRDK